MRRIKTQDYIKHRREPMLDTCLCPLQMHFSDAFKNFYFYMNVDL